ncbi:MAG: PilN domain-containing protein [Acidaminococcaceae bacterium]|jgi:Tfp pilus assembly protein PilN|nr:PilN domain-containing protein [Acidaminococcaceae bacterium]MCI2110669.1 PilN domain-containing protein [Acidaminococcaceae bacterium]
MININLLPKDKRKKAFPFYKIFLFATYFVVALTILVWGVNLALFKYSESKLNAVNDSLGAMSLWQQRYTLHNAQNADITKRANIAKDLSKKRVLWSSSLASLGNITPYGCWLTGVSQDSKDERKISLHGRAFKLDQVLAFVHNLQTDPLIASVTLVNSTSNKSGTVKIVDYEIIAVMKGGSPNAK